VPEPSPIPTLLAFIVCDTVIQDAATQKRTLVGVFDRVHSPIIPFVLNSVGLYVKMVEGVGKYNFRIRLVNLKDESPVIEIKMDGQWIDSDAPMELGVNFGGIPIPEFGTYEFQLFADDVFLGRALLQTAKLQLPPPGPVKGS
jgi:hypothetical protein